MKNFPSDKIENLFYQNYSPLTEKEILRINHEQMSAELNNVINGLSSHFFALFLEEEFETDLSYGLCYINGEKKLEGDILHLTLNNKYRDYLVYYFSNLLANSYSRLDPITVFNTFQSKTRGLLELFKYTTIDGDFFDKLNNPVFFSLKSKGVVRINFINRLNLYKEIFIAKEPPHGITECIYLMLDSKTNLVKIGRSKKLVYREKTLQAEKPSIKLITYWVAPFEKEKELHEIFSEKRVRGEWFNLRLSDLKIIKEFLKEYD